MWLRSIIFRGWVVHLWEYRQWTGKWYGYSWITDKRKRYTCLSFCSKRTKLSNQSYNEYMEMVKKGIAKLSPWWCIQIVLSRRFQQSFMGDEFNVYRRWEASILHLIYFLIMAIINWWVLRRKHSCWSGISRPWYILSPALFNERWADEADKAGSGY